MRSDRGGSPLHLTWARVSLWQCRGPFPLSGQSQPRRAMLPFFFFLSTGRAAPLPLYVCCLSGFISPTDLPTVWERWTIHRRRLRPVFFIFFVCLLACSSTLWLLVPDYPRIVPRRTATMEREKREREREMYAVAMTKRRLWSGGRIFELRRRSGNVYWKGQKKTIVCDALQELRLVYVEMLWGEAMVTHVSLIQRCNLILYHFEFRFIFLRKFTRLKKDCQSILLLYTAWKLFLYFFIYLFFLINYIN